MAIYLITEVETATKAWLFRVEAESEDEAYELVSEGSFQDTGEAINDWEPFEWEITNVELEEDEWVN